MDASRLTVTRPVMLLGSRAGTLVIRSDLSERDERLRRYAIMAAIVALGALLVALIAGSGLQRVVTRPLLSLAEAARGVSERNDLAQRVPAIGSGDELDVLVTAFNQMLEGLRRRDEALLQAQAELELRLEERTALYQQAEEANRLKDEFLATLSHELRTPLNAIVGWSALLVRGELDAAMEERAVAAIDRNARAQVRLIEDVLDVSRIVSGKLSLKVEPVDLVDLVRRALESVSHAAAAKDIGLELRIESEPLAITADPGRLQQVLWNLLSNAMKFTEPHGHVRVTVARAKDAAQVIVQDDGIGIAPEFLPHMFERFRQADASSTRAHGGLGLGLAIVRHLVEMHGGTVDVTSQGRGKGTTFTVALPLAPPGTRAVPHAVGS